MQDGPARKKHDELSESQAKIVKMIFVGLGFVTIATLVLILEVLVPIPYVVSGLLGIGIVYVLYYDLVRSPRMRSQQPGPRSQSS
jgi:hypothetical protein